MSTADYANTTLESAEDQITKLRAQVDGLMKERVVPAMHDAVDKAGAAMSAASDTVRNSADAVSGKVRDQPLIAMLVAAGVGFLIGRALR